jgi:uncharacterized membrane protein YhaH (DUF805 family)
MNFGQAIASAFANYADFGNRACRAEYWYFALLNFLVGNATQLIAQSYPQEAHLVHGLWGLVVFIPSLAVAVRRLHDIGKSGWYLLLLLLPLIGWIILLIWLAQRGNEAPNKYGSSPI